MYNVSQDLFDLDMQVEVESRERVICSTSSYLICQTTTAPNK